MTAPDGTPVNAVRGFVDTIARVITDRGAARLVACLDADWRPEFRVKALPSYKAHRVAESADDGSEEVPDTSRRRSRSSSTCWTPRASAPARPRATRRTT